MEHLPKFFMISSDDEFAGFEWTNTWYDKFTGEKSLYIVPNAEHELITGFHELYSSLG